jgi:nitrogen-specific signal transduction histidine kinase
MSEKKDTDSHPAGKLERNETTRQAREVRGEALLSQTLDRLQGLILVVNAQRKVVFANQAFLDFFSAGDAEDICGMRPGEIFHCAHADEAEGGCGESESCQFCGVVQAIRETQATRKPATRECHIARGEEAEVTSHEFLARTVPFEIGGTPYVLVSLRDVGGQKRRIALERIFFHDILNTASSIKVYLDLLRNGLSDDGNRKLLERLESIADTLLEEIQSQKILVSAENKTLTVQKNLIVSTGFITRIIQPFEELDVSRGKKIVVAPFSESFSFMSDDSLLRRVIANMLKNALEASPEGATVTVGFGKIDVERVRFWIHNPTFIEEVIQRQIFQRYFSTKGEDRGLGTYSMKLLTEEYLGGKVGFESTREKGTTFSVTIPVRP